MPPANNSLLLPNIVIASLPYAVINSHVGMNGKCECESVNVDVSITRVVLVVA